MLARCTAFIATSLDGYIARPDGSIDWLTEANALVPAGEDCGYGAYMAGIDAIVMGRHTFEQVLTFPEWPYGGSHVYVLSRFLAALPVEAPATTSLHACPPRELAAIAWGRGHRNLYIDGGLTIQSFLAAGLLAEITITVLPVLLGAGRPLFASGAFDQAWLKHVSTHAYPFGFVQSRYLIPANA